VPKSGDIAESMDAHPQHLFPVEDHGRARRTDPDTSRHAAAKVASVTDLIYAAFVTYGPMTDDALCERLELPTRRWPTAKTARSRLHKDGVLVDSGERRLSGAGRPMIVWALAESARPS
jgi:predicted ArsR family transcriptional regulator